MSWNGTVRCGWCYKEGHNKRSCPDYQKYMQDRLKNDPDDYYAKRHFEKKKAAKVRRCTYCNLKGHNRATCPDLKQDVIKWKARNASYRHRLASTLLAEGFGVGALIKHQGKGWRIDAKKNVVMVKGLNPGTTVGAPWNCLIICGVMNPRQTNHVGLTTELMNEITQTEEGGTYHYGDAVEVLSPTKNCLLRTIPDHEEWLKGGDEKWIKKEIFGDCKSDNFYNNKYKD